MVLLIADFRQAPDGFDSFASASRWLDYYWSVVEPFKFIYGPALASNY